MAKLGPSPERESFYQELVTLLDKHAGHLTGLEMLAVASNVVGKLVAMQDQRRVTPDRAMRIVTRNIEEGNREAVRDLMSRTAGRG